MADVNNNDSTEPAEGLEPDYTDTTEEYLPDQAGGVLDGADDTYENAYQQGYDAATKNSRPAAGRPSPKTSSLNASDPSSTEQPSPDKEKEEPDGSSAPEKSSEKSTGSNKDHDKRPGGQGGKSTGTPKSAVALGKNLASKLASFSKKNKNEIAIGGGIMGLVISVFILILSLAPLKLVNMMENIYGYAWNKNNIAFDIRRKSIVKTFLRERAGITTNSGVPLADGVPESERAFWNKAFLRMAGDNKFVRGLRESGYFAELDPANPNRLKIYGSTFDIETRQIIKTYPISDYDLLTDKRGARKEVNRIVAEATKDKNWFKRIYEKRRYQRRTNTKWSWLDPIDQPLNKLKKKVATEVVEYSLKNKFTAKFVTKIILGILGVDPTKEPPELNKAVTELGQGSADIIDAKISDEATERIANEVAEKITNEAVEGVARGLATQLVEKVASISNPVGWVLLAVGIICTGNGLADNGTIQKALNGYASFQYMLTFTKWESMSSQIKNGNADGNMGPKELSANMDLLVSADGKKDIGASNNYRRAAGEKIPYDPDSEIANDCSKGAELCVVKQPRCAVYSSAFGKVVMLGIAGFNSQKAASDYQYCKKALVNDPLDLLTKAQGIIFSNSFFASFAGVQGATVDVVCNIFNVVSDAVGWVFGKVFDLAGAVCDVPLVGDLLGGPCAAIDGLKELGGAAITWLSEHAIGAIASPVIGGQIRGPELANAISAGANFQANSSLKELKAKPITQAQATSYENRYYASLRDKHNAASTFEKIFSFQDKYSLASQLTYKMPTTPYVAFSSAQESIVRLSTPSLAMNNIQIFFGGLLRSFSGTAVADEPYKDPFGLRTDGVECDTEMDNTNCVYGFTDEELALPTGSGVMKDIDQQIACSLIANISPGDENKPIECIAAEEAPDAI